jgi:hypothetical protein
MITPLAHRDPKSGNEEPLRDHLRLVAERAAEYASAFGAEHNRAPPTPVLRSWTHTP